MIHTDDVYHLDSRDSCKKSKNENNFWMKKNGKFGSINSMFDYTR